MAEMPTALERRELLYGKPKRKPNYTALGDSYAQAGNLNDAVECYERLEASQRDAKLKDLRDAAIKAGNHFVLNRIDNNLPLSQDQWRDAAKQAQEAGKLRYALKSALRAEDETLAAALREALGMPQPGQVEGAEGVVDYLPTDDAEGDDAAAEGDPEGEEPVG